jgi:hypothetical protein
VKLVFESKPESQWTFAGMADPHPALSRDRFAAGEGALVGHLDLSSMFGPLRDVGKDEP